MATTPKKPDAGGVRVASSQQSGPRAQPKLAKMAKADAKGDRAPAADVPAAAPIDESRVRARAHAIWIQEGKPEGRDVEHWLRARWELEQENP